jgi:hypothetical protein
MSNSTSITQVPQNPEVYPCVLFPKTIEQNFPKLVEVRQRIPTEGTLDRGQLNSIVTEKFVPSNLISISSVLGIVSLLILIARFFNVYQHNGIAIAMTIACISSFIWYGRLVKKEKAAYYRKLNRQSIKKSLQDGRVAIKQTIISEDLQLPNWQHILSDKVLKHDGISTAQVGTSEPEFNKYLIKYFEPILKPSYSFNIPNFHKPYSADFCLQLPCGLSFDLEIDEPYVGNTGNPHHCIDDDKDEIRDRFFAAGNWITIRFSEKQVVTQPDECCYLVAMLIEALTGDSTIKHKFNPSTTLPIRDSRWTKLESQEMAKNKYRDSYLPKFKANQSTKRANTAKSSKSVKLSSKKIIKPKPKPKM